MFARIAVLDQVNLGKRGVLLPQGVAERGMVFGSSGLRVMVDALQGLECDEASLNISQFGQECNSPRSWDGLKEDTRCRSASTSDSQHSEGEKFFLI